MTTLRTLLFTALILVSFLAQSQTALPRIRVAGNQFVTPDGQPVVFAGVSSSDPDKLEKDGHWNAAYFQEIRKWGANIVRFPVHPRAWRERGREAYLALLDQGIGWATANELYVIIDWHSIGNLRSELFYKPGYETTKKETFEFWQTIAARYKDHTTVAFLELYNEPTTNNGLMGTCTWQQWKELMEEIIVIVRAHGSQAIPLVAGFNWAYDLTEVRENPIEAEGIAYVSHPYPQKREQPWEPKWTRDWGYVAEKYPVILTEVGFCGPNDRGAHIPVISDTSYGDALTAYCAERGISYVVWVFDPQWSPMMIHDWTFRPTMQGEYFRKVWGE